MAIDRLSEALAHSQRAEDKAMATQLQSFLAERGEDIAIPVEAEQHEAGMLLTLGQLSSRMLIPRNNETDIYSQSVEALAQRTENLAQFREIINAITEPYETLFTSQTMDRSANRGVQFIRWAHTALTDGGRLSSAVKVDFRKQKKQPVELVSASVNLRGDYDEVDTNLNIQFFDNKISRLSLKYGNVKDPYFNNDRAKPSEAKTFAKAVKGTHLGKFIDLTINPGFAYEHQIDSAGITVELRSDLPVIDCSRDFYVPSGGAWTKRKVHSSFIYDASTNEIRRGKGLGELNPDDDLEKLAISDFAMIVKDLLDLVPAVDL